MVVAPNTERFPETSGLPLALGSPFSTQPASSPSFMPSLTVDSKSDLPESLKSTYGTAGIGAPDSLQERSTTAPTFDLAKQLKSEFVQPLLGATNDSPKLTHKQQAGGDISLVKLHGKTDSIELEDHHKAKPDDSLLKLPTVKVPEYKLINSSEQTFTQSEGAMAVQDYQNQTAEQSEESSPLSQGSQQSKLSSVTASHPTGSLLTSHKSRNSSLSDAQLLSQPSHGIELSECSTNATSELKQQGIEFDISTLHRTLEDSDSTDTETDEESRVSLLPPSWSLSSAKERKPMRVHPNVKHVSSTVQVDRKNENMKSSTSSGFVEVSTGGAWSQKVRQARPSGMDILHICNFPCHSEYLQSSTVVLQGPGL